MAANRSCSDEGIASGSRRPGSSTERTIAQLERLLETPVEESVVSTDRQGRLGSRSRADPGARPRRRLCPPIAAFLEALRGDYLPASRDDPGLWSAPDGDALYRTQILAWTTLEIDPEEVHQIGLEELEAIETERRAIARAEGFGDDTAAYRRSLASRAGQCPGDPG